MENEELIDGKGEFQTNRGADRWERPIPNQPEQHGHRSGAVAVEPRGGRAEQPRAGSGAAVRPGLWPPRAGSCTRAWKSSPKGADDFLLGIEGSGSWQKLTWVFWLLVEEAGELRVQPRGRWWDGDGHGTLSPPWANSPTAAQQIIKCSSTGWKLPCFQSKEQIMGYFPPKILGEKVCEHQMYGLLFPSYNWDGNPLHPAALKEGNKQPVLIIELHIA